MDQADFSPELPQCRTPIRERSKASAIEFDAAGIGEERARHQTQQRRLSCAARPDKGHRSASIELQRNLLQYGLTAQSQRDLVDIEASGVGQKNAARLA